MSKSNNFGQLDMIFGMHSYAQYLIQDEKNNLNILKHKGPQLGMVLVFITFHDI